MRGILESYKLIITEYNGKTLLSEAFYYPSKDELEIIDLTTEDLIPVKPTQKIIEVLKKQLENDCLHAAAPTIPGIDC